MDLAERHEFVDIKPEKIRSLLGPNTCYIHYDDEPCYKVKVNNKTRFLVFPVAHSGNQIGNITGAYLRSDPSTFTGCSYE